MATGLRIEVDDEMLSKLQALAQDMDRTVEELCVLALHDFVPEMRDYVDDVSEGFRDCDDGRTIPHEAVSAWLQSYGTSEQLPMPTARATRLTRAS